ncbi:gamma-soluble NSF attachment protein-like isoform X2 [Amphiura filiformis]|uniref:gamma-soluble NSF attachment protein-like isoform X2 n=1 Tax=Amphiura filiformis TaxID=82378 RepID=UPI003B2196A7
MASNQKVSEALEHIEKAEKSLKTSFFKWTPDFDSAAHEYEKAAVCYKNAKSPADARKMYIKAADCHRNCQALFHAAKDYKQAGFICKDLKKYDECVDLIKKAAFMYREHGAPDTAAITLEKAAKTMETVNTNVAVDLYMEAADIVMVDERLRQAVDSLSKASRLLVRNRDFQKALEVMKKELDMYVELEQEGKIHKCIAIQILIHLHRGDWVAADQAHKTAMGYIGYAQSEVSLLLQELIEAYDQQDPDKASELLYNPYFTHLDNDYVKLARTLRVPGYGGGGAGGGGGGGEQQEEEDEYAGGLC